MKKEKNRKAGFSLLELLAVIVVVSLVFGVTGYFVMNSIQKSQEKSDEIALSSVKRTANIYVQEYSSESIWIDDESNSDYTCVSITTLINKGYLTNVDIENTSFTSDYIIVTRDKNKSIIKEELDTKGVCGVSSNQKVPIPTSKEYCKNNIYDPNKTDSDPLVLTKELEDDAKFSFSNNTGVNAGSYQVDVNLAAGYIWEDDTTDSKKITCTIKKRVPTLSLSLLGSANVIIGLLPTSSTPKLTSDVSGIVSTKSSNKEIAISNLVDKAIIADVEKVIPIEVLSTRKTKTYITITVTPDDQTNYYSSSVVYTIGDIIRIPINKPTSSFCTNPYYNGEFQAITTSLSGNEGYQLYGTFQKEISDHHIVTAKLKYGYTWGDGSLDNVTFECKIKRPTPTVSYNSNTGNACNPSSKVVTYEYEYGSLCAPTKTGYTFSDWHTSAIGGALIRSDTIVTNFRNHTIYAHWTPNKYTATMNANGGTNGSNYSSTWTATYDQSYSLDSYVPTRTGYLFDGWYTSATGGSKFSGSWIWNFTSDYTFYAHWTPKTIKVTFKRNYSSSDNTQTTQTFTYGKSNQSFNSGFSRTGYTALGWSTSRSATSALYSFQSGVADGWIDVHYPSITLYAVWIDNIKPTCTAVSDGTWRSSGAKVTVTCSDNGSGCKIATQSKTGVKSNTTYTVYDNADNSATCKFSIQTRKMYRKRTCKTCKSCSIVTGQKCSSGHYECLYGCAAVGTTGYTERTSATCTNPNPNWCSEKSRWYVCDLYTNVTQSITSCSRCGGCSSWNTWSDYIYSSCTSSSTRQCGSRMEYK